MCMPRVRYGRRSIPHAELRTLAARIASALHAEGVGHGDRVAIVLRNEPTFLTVSAACGLMGAVPVAVNWHSRGAELRHVLSHSGAKVICVHSDLVAEVEATAPAHALPIIEVPVPVELAEHYGQALVTGRHRVLDEWLDGHGPYAEVLDVAPLSLIYTSGTTGLAKGVLAPPDDARSVPAGGLSHPGGDGPAARDAHAHHRAHVPCGAQRPGTVRTRAGHRVDDHAAL